MDKTLNPEKLKLRRSRLEGNVKVSGAKNSCLRLLAASVLSSSSIRLTNYPAQLLDAVVHVGMLESLGKKCDVGPDSIVISEPDGIDNVLNWDGRSIRNTLLLLGALTARTGKGSVPLPGGCKLGERGYDIHIDVLEKLGAKVWSEGDRLLAESKGPRLVGNDIHLRLRSTGATENAILASTLAEGRTRIWNPHFRPEILDLIALLTRMGARIEVRGQESIIVYGVDSLDGASHQVIPDNVEALTWLVGAVVTGGDVEIFDFPFEHLEAPLIHLRESGAKFYRGQNSLIVRGGECYPVDISTGPYPGINSDMQPLFAVYGAIAQGESRITDLRFPGRYGYADELKKLGVESEVLGDMLRIFGGKRMLGHEVRALDLRAGIALTLAGFVADGETVINDAWQICRGYDGLETKLAQLNAHFTMSGANSSQ